MAGTLPPIFIISDDDHGGYAAVAVYTLLALTVFVVVTRLSARYYIGKVVQVDDYLLAGATLLAILQSVFVQLSISHGLGKRQDTVSAGSLNLFEEYLYIAQILLIATVSLSKLSISLLFKSLMNRGFSQWANWGLISSIVAWTIASIVALAARCSSPHPWDFVDGQCDNLGVMYDTIGAFNIITDAAIILLSCGVLWTVQVSMAKRVRIISLLAIRLVYVVPFPAVSKAIQETRMELDIANIMVNSVILSVAFQIHYYGIVVSSSDKTWAQMNASIWDQAVLNLSIIATAIPSLGRLAHELQPNVNAFAMTENHGLRSRDKYTISSLANHYPRRAMEENMLGTHTSVVHGSTDDDTESMEALVREGIQQNVFVQRTVELKVE